MKNTVSIVIPCYNYAAFLSEAIESALAQNRKALEIIIIDDGSTDDTAQIAKKYRGKIDYYYQKNQGLAAARNLGLKKCKGDYVVFLDADDTLEPNYIEACLKVFAQNPGIAYVYTQMKWFGRENFITDYPDYDINKLKVGNFINASAMTKADVARKIKYDTSFKTGWEDWDFYLTLAERGYTGQLLDRPLLNYRRHTNTSSMIDKHMKSLLSQRRAMLKLIKKHPGLYGAKDLAKTQLYYLIKMLLFGRDRQLKDWLRQS